MSIFRTGARGKGTWNFKLQLPASEKAPSFVPEFRLGKPRGGSLLLPADPGTDEEADDEEDEDDDDEDLMAGSKSATVASRRARKGSVASESASELPVGVGGGCGAGGRVLWATGTGLKGQCISPSCMRSRVCFLILAFVCY